MTLRAELQARDAGATRRREVEQPKVRVVAQEASLVAAEATRDAVQAQLDIELPARLTTAKTELVQAQVALDDARRRRHRRHRPAVRTAPGRHRQPDAAARRHPRPERRVTGLVAGFGQIESRVIKIGMVGEVACIASRSRDPGGGDRDSRRDRIGPDRTDRPILGVALFSRPGTITALMEPLYEGGLDRLPQGSTCVANAYTRNYEALQDPNIGAFRAFVLHAIDATALVHAMT